MEQTFYFYDLETSGIDPRSQRIMQFAGQRTTMDLVPIGDPDDYFIQLTSDVLPDPDAILLTGITPQKTLAEGYTEKQFIDIFLADIAKPGTVFVGFNTIRFDDEFMRNTLYRNLYDPYEWQWKDGRCKWDLLDVARMTRALRPDGINWPYTPSGKQINRLELIAAINNLEHTDAHNALSDVSASIEVAKMMMSRQPKLFTYLLGMRNKQVVAAFVSSGLPFVYTSGRYPSEYQKTTVVMPIGDGNDPGTTVVYDLRIDPELWLSQQGSLTKETYSPLKLLKHNHCPAIAPLSVLDMESIARIKIDMKSLEDNKKKLAKLKDQVFATYISKKRKASQTLIAEPLASVDKMMYDGFIGAQDKRLNDRIHAMDQLELVEFVPEYVDKRLPELYFLYKARQFPKSLMSEDRQRYDAYVAEKLTMGEVNLYGEHIAKLEQLAKVEYLDADKRYILEELALYAQSIVPLDGY